MAKSITKKNTLSIKAVMTVEDDIVYIQTEEMDEAVPLAAYCGDFDGYEVSVSIGQTTEM